MERLLHGKCVWLDTVGYFLEFRDVLQDHLDGLAGGVRELVVAGVSVGDAVEELEEGGCCGEVVSDGRGFDLALGDGMAGGQENGVTGHHMVEFGEVHGREDYREQEREELAVDGPPKKVEATGTNRPCFRGFLGRSHEEAVDNCEFREERSSADGRKRSQCFLSS